LFAKLEKSVPLIALYVIDWFHRIDASCATSDCVCDVVGVGGELVLRHVGDLFRRGSGQRKGLPKSLVGMPNPAAFVGRNTGLKAARRFMECSPVVPRLMLRCACGRDVAATIMNESTRPPCVKSVI
jgi:hypothetical protein